MDDEREELERLTLPIDRLEEAAQQDYSGHPWWDNEETKPFGERPMLDTEDMTSGGCVPHFDADDGCAATTDAAKKTAKRFVKEGWSRVIRDRNGGLEFSRVRDRLSHDLHIWADGTAERVVWNDGQLISRTTV